MPNPEYFLQRAAFYRQLAAESTTVSKIRSGLPISSLEWGTICAF
jgi:hypothetical protein